MISDYHLHTSHSADSEADMRSMIEGGIRQGIKTMCFTEHMDYDAPPEMGSFIVDTESYYKEYCLLRQEYESQIELLFGVELGLQPHLAKWHRNYVESYPFDFIIGSSHAVGGHDPYYPAFFEGRSEEASYRQYFESIAENLCAFSDFDTYGHLDYVVRYGPNKNRDYSYEKYKDAIDTVLGLLIEKKIALEVNTGGFKYGLGEANPCSDILKAYKRMGGEMVTLGSDAHEPRYIAYEFAEIKRILQKCGFSRYLEFRKREPRFAEI